MNFSKNALPLNIDNGKGDTILVALNNKGEFIISKIKGNPVISLSEIMTNNNANVKINDFSF